MNQPLILPYANPQALAYGVEREMKGQGISGMMTFPWNRYEPSKSMWWISPSTDNPAYRYGKYIFEPALSPNRDVFTGMHVEKGFGPPAGLVMSSKSHRSGLMDEEWTWGRFVKDTAGGLLNGPLMKVAESAGGSVTIHADAFYYQGGEYDPYSQENDVDVVEFSTNEVGMTLDESASHTDRQLLACASKCTDLPSLGVALRNLPDQDWVWVNFYMGVGFDLDREGRYARIWSAGRLWREVLHPLHRWFR